MESFSSSIGNRLEKQKGYGYENENGDIGVGNEEGFAVAKRRHSYAACFLQIFLISDAVSLLMAAVIRRLLMRPRKKLTIDWGFIPRSRAKAAMLKLAEASAILNSRSLTFLPGSFILPLFIR
jgi:hypothetical protein